ncbi:MAG: hypothetical protein O2794_01290 [bacterium]|nr:hypothetical protein [bacterium]
MQLKKLTLEACVHSDDGSKEAGRGLSTAEFQRIHREVLEFIEAGAVACTGLTLRVKIRKKETLYHVAWHAELTD